MTKKQKNKSYQYALCLFTCRLHSTIHRDGALKILIKFEYYYYTCNWNLMKHIQNITQTQSVSIFRIRSNEKSDNSNYIHSRLGSLSLFISLSNKQTANGWDKTATKYMVLIYFIQLYNYYTFKNVDILFSEAMIVIYIISKQTNVHLLNGMEHDFPHKMAAKTRSSIKCHSHK